MIRSLCFIGWMTCALLTEGGCVRDAPVKRYRRPAPPPPWRIPAGCAGDQSGTYVHQNDGNFRYQASDDGGTLVLTVERLTQDAGEGSAGPMISLQRTPRGFLGAARSQAFTPSGKDCAVEFPTEVLACLDGGLLLQSAASAAFDDSCALADSRSVAMLQHWLTRDPNARADGGFGDGHR